MAAPIITRLVLRTKSFRSAARGASDALKPIRAGLGFLAGLAGKAAFALAGLSAVLAAIVVRQTAFIGRLNDTSQKLGINIQFLQKFRYAAQQSGVGIDTADMALQRFTRRIAEAAQGTGEARGALAQLGINVRDTSGNLRSMEDILFDVSDGIAQTTDEAERVRLAFKFFDSEGVALVNTLSEGSAALQEMFNRAQSLGGILTADAAAGVKRFDDALTDLQVLVAGVSNQFVAALAPALEAATQAFIEFVTEIAEQQGGFESLGKYLKDQFIEIVQNVIRAFVTLFNVVVNIVNGIQTALAKLGLIEDVSAIRATIAELREESNKSFFEKIMGGGGGLKLLIGQFAELRDEFGLIEYFSEEDYAKAIRILEQKAAELESQGLGVNLINPIDEETLQGYLNFWEKYTEAAVEARVATSEMAKQMNSETLTVAEDVGFTIGKLLDAIFGVDRMTEFYASLETATENFIKAIRPALEASGVGNFMKTLEDGFVSAVQKFESSLADAIITGKADFSSLADHIKKVFAQAMIQKFITGPLLGAFGLGVPGRAMGGPVTSGQTYMVGEKGPELFVPNTSGTIVPNNQIASNGGTPVGVGGITQVTYNINALDSRSWKQMLAQDPEYMFNLTQAGARRVPG